MTVGACRGRVGALAHRTGINRLRGRRLLQQAPSDVYPLLSRIFPAALQRWDKLLESELIKSHGLQSNLAILVQHRYLLSRADADKQVRSFLVPG